MTIEEKEKIAVQYLYDNISDKKLKLKLNENKDSLSAVLTLEFEADDYYDYDEGSFAVKDSVVDDRIESALEDYLGVFESKDTELGFDFEVEYDSDYDNNLSGYCHMTCPASYYHPAEYDSEFDEELEVNIDFIINIIDKEDK